MPSKVIPANKVMFLPVLRRPSALARSPRGARAYAEAIPLSSNTVTRRAARVSATSRHACRTVSSRSAAWSVFFFEVGQTAARPDSSLNH